MSVSDGPVLFSTPFLLVAAFKFSSVEPPFSIVNYCSLRGTDPFHSQVTGINRKFL